MVAIISGTIFLGPELSRNEDYIDASINFTVALFTGVAKLKQWSPWLRWLGQYYVPELKALREYRKKAQTFLAPVIQERLQLMKDGAELPEDMLQWMLNKRTEYGISEDDMAELQLSLSVAAIHTTTATVTLA